METLKETMERALSFRMTKTALAQELGTETKVLWEWKNGKRSMPDDKLIKLAAIAGTDPIKLLGQYHYERWQSLGKAQSGIATVGSVAAVATAAVIASLASVWNLGALITAMPETLRIMFIMSTGLKSFALRSAGFP